MQSNSGVDHLSLGLSCERGMVGSPHLVRRLESDDLGKDLAGEGSHQVPLKLLLLSRPEDSCHVDNLFLLPVLSDGESGRRRLARRFKEVLHLGAFDLRQHDGLPQEKIAPS